ncbi:MAG: type II toxin-antitoxin system RelE/ParE family toxin [Rickettsiales bacterium]|nr:type II toxin-antitoxin system RelE/ParE family toxin [Rickettsiales bacterium]
MIVSFKCNLTKKLYLDSPVKEFKNFESVTRRKLFQLANAFNINDLSSPPGNRLEKLKGDRKDQYSIRINDKYRLCFEWNNGNAENVEIIDYH